MWKARVAELEARPSVEDHQIARSNRQSNAERKLKLVRRAMLGLLEELGVKWHTRNTLGSYFLI